MLKAGREFEVLHQNSLDDKIWTSVAASGDAYLIKGLDTLYCIRNDSRSASNAVTGGTPIR